MDKYLVIGSGISGLGSVSLLEQMGADVTLYDSNEKLTAADLQKKLPAGSTAKCIAGALPEEVAASVSTVVLSPGVPVDIPLVLSLKEKGAGIIGEIELGYRNEQGTVVAITGTNGKTTTTTLVGEIMKAHYGEEASFVVGNIGYPYTSECLKTTKESVTVGEISSFQLETIDRFHPKVSAILNITPDHLDRHHTMDAYVEAKQNITLNQTERDVCVLNYDNEYTKAIGEVCKPRVIYFSSARMLEDGYSLDGDTIVRVTEGEKKAVLNIHRDMHLVGLCNVENVMAALAIAEGMEIPLETTLQVIRDFRAVEHRIEFVETKGGVDYYNDSKGTNPDAAIQGIRAMSKPTILIGGGYDKQSRYDEWIESFDGKVKWLVLIGQTREKIAECARKHGFTNIKFADTYEECLKLCTALAEEGDAVLLSPACASWGMFPNYEERGRIFKEYVRNLA